MTAPYPSSPEDRARVADRPWTKAPRPLPTTSQGWVPDVLVGLVVAVFGIAELLRFSWVTAGERGSIALVIAFTAVSVALARHLPGPALALVWATCLAQGLLGLPVLITQVAVAAVAFGTARWGSRVTLVAGLASMPAAGFAFLTLAQLGQFDAVLFRGDGSTALAYTIYDRLGSSWPLALLALFTTLLLAPWLVGVSLRLAERARSSRISQVAAEEDAARAHRETEQAQEIARLTEEQSRMARDVHDVVGHSLAVILAQAESAQFLKGEERLQETLATIATSARASLQDVRQVLSGPQAPTTAVLSDDAVALVDGVRRSGFVVEHREVGAARPLPPELATVAHRVLQEMLTNAMRHGRRDTTVEVERHWPDGRWEQELRIEVRNMVADGQGNEPDLDGSEATRPITADGSGRGVDGMRRRLEAVGGRLDVRRRDEANGTSYTATAWVPVRAGGPA
ncbi:MAG TPA: histidine kinase [Nocardioides sp.]